MTTPTYSPDELSQLLIAGALLDGRPSMQAAVHLLTFTAFTHQVDAGTLIELDNDADPDAPVTAAFVRDWPAVESIAVARRWGSGDLQLVALAVSLAAGEPVDLRDNVTAGGYAHARRIIEGVAIATGYGAHYAITATPALEQMLADRDALLSS